MADIELVIKIPEEYYKSIKDDAKKFLSKGMKVPSLYEKVIKGTPLPKGHGRLIDENDLWFEDIDDISCVTQRNIENAPTIVEAADECDEEKIRQEREDSYSIESLC